MREKAKKKIGLKTGFLSDLNLNISKLGCSKAVRAIL